MVNAEEYISWINKYISNHDTREINFQNDVIKRLLEKKFPQYDIVCVDTKGNATKNHNYYAYSGTYIDEKGREKPTTPDLLICKDWDWFNVDNSNISYIATVEVKSPYGSEAIYKRNYEEYQDKWRKKIETHLSATKIEKVIFTDSFKWDFFKERYDQWETIELVERVRKGRGYTYKWREDVNEQFEKLLRKLDDFL